MSNGAATRVQRSREKILAAAEDVFLHAGFLGANMDAIAESASVSKQTVYAHFQSKEALFLEVIAAMTGDAARTIGEDGEERLDDRPVRDYLTAVAIDQLTVVMTPRLMQLRRMVIGEIEREQELGAQSFTDWLHMGFGPLVHIGDGEFGTGLREGAGAAGGNGFVISDADNEADLAGERAFTAIRVKFFAHAAILFAVHIPIHSKP